MYLAYRSRFVPRLFSSQAFYRGPRSPEYENAKTRGFRRFTCARNFSVALLLSGIRPACHALPLTPSSWSPDNQTSFPAVNYTLLLLIPKVPRIDSSTLTSMVHHGHAHWLDLSITISRLSWDTSSRTRLGSSDYRRELEDLNALRNNGDEEHGSRLSHRFPSHFYLFLHGFVNCARYQCLCSVTCGRRATLISPWQSVTNSKGLFSGSQTRRERKMRRSAFHGVPFSRTCTSLFTGLFI